MDITDSRYSWARLLVSVIIATIGNVGMWAIIVIMPDMQAEFDLSRADASLPYTATMLGFALGNFVVGRVVDRYGMVVSLIGASLVNAGAFYAASVTSNLMILALVQAILGFGTATTFGPLMADVSHWFTCQGPFGL
jgi:MFS family permease